MLDFIRIACAVPDGKTADVKKNAQTIVVWMEKAEELHADVILFPELALTGYTCGDLFFQNSLHNAVKDGVREISRCSAAYPQLTAVVGLPVRAGGRLYNCAAVFSRGEVVGLVPKTCLTTAEKRWFSPAEKERIWLSPEALGMTSDQDYWTIPMSADQMFRLAEDTLVGITLCQDDLGPRPRSGELSTNGAEVVLNLAASAEMAGKRAFHRAFVETQSALCNCVYTYASAGCSESTTDFVFSGQSIIAENGRILRENENYVDSGYLLLADCDLGRIRADRIRNQTFGQIPDSWLCRDTFGDRLRSDGTLYPVRKLPFIPNTREARIQRCMEIFQLQVTGLKRRLTAIGGANAVIGISGGLDSTLALLVAVEAMRQLGRPATDVYGVTMPCFGTSDRTYRNAWEMMEKLGISCKEIPIREAVSLHFADIGHDPSVHNATYENAQARERTQILMDYASVVGGIVVGTGDLSELALGWCTYNGDHMSMYSVNGTVPKTLIRWMIDAISETESFAAAHDVLQDVLDTPISPELLPPDASGKISQQTEDLVGPYALHDFFIFHALRYGFHPEKIYTLACRAFADDFDQAIIKKWLKSFYRRFFTQQFKRSCLPDGVKVGSVGLGPRGDWVMPSDASAAAWAEEAENL